ncbi:MAG: PAS domain-containing protein, partial [Nodosilinea sp.]
MVTDPFCHASDRYQSPVSVDESAPLQVIVDSLPACIAYLDTDLRYRFANRTYEAWFHLDSHTISGRYLWEVIGQEAFQKVEPYVRRVLEGRQITVETTITYDRGSRQVRGTLTPDFNDQAQVQGYHSLIIDISRYKQAEIQLRRSEAALTKAQEIAHIGSWEFDIVTQSLDCSAEMLRLFDLPPSELPPNLPQLAQFFSPENWAQVRQAVQQLMITGQPQPFAGHIVLPNGESRYLEGSSEAVKNDQGKVVKLLGTAMDVTEHKQRIDQLRLLEAVVLHANDAVLITEADQIDFPGPRIIYANPAFAAMTGYASAEIIGQTPRILQGPKTNRAKLNQIRAALKAQIHIRVELVHYR